MSENEPIRPGKLSPKSLAPLFYLMALIHAAAVVTRFDEVAIRLPASMAAAILLAQFPLLLIGGFFEGRLDYGEAAEDFPLWMRIRSRSVKLAFTFAFTYLAVVVLQAWNVEIGPVDPSPPPEWSLSKRIWWFGIMSGGMFFPNYLLACSLLIPLLRAITTPFHRLPAVVALAILSIVGAGIGYTVVRLVSSRDLEGGIDALQSALSEKPAVAIGIALGMAWIPILWGLVVARRE
ncbi:hypothetical protein ACFL6C_10410 [Myxococcota bacterium]